MSMRRFTRHRRIQQEVRELAGGGFPKFGALQSRSPAQDLARYASHGGKRSGSGMVARGIGGANVEIRQRVMGKVKVYRFRTYDAAKDDWFISTRMATREEIESSKTLELVPGTEAEIDSKHLLLGRWTDRNFDPRKSN